MSSTLALRVPDDIKAGLQRLADKTHRSRNYHSVMALRKYINDFERQEASGASRSVYDIALSYSGAAVEAGAKPKSIEEIDRLIRDLRDDG